MSVSKLLVLHRMMDFSQATASARVLTARRIVMAAVVAGNLTGVCANVVASVYYRESSYLYTDAAVFYAANNSAGGDAARARGRTVNSAAAEIASVQEFCEVFVLLLIIAAFAVVGAASARRVSSALRSNNEAAGGLTVANAAGLQLRRKIVGVTAFVFVTFLLRAAFSIMFALANARQNYATTCGSGTADRVCNGACINTFGLMQTWLQYTPAMQSTFELISSPLALLVALWGMTNKRHLVFMASRNSGKYKQSAGGGPTAAASLAPL
jgi:hypothetical protein